MTDIEKAQYKNLRTAFGMLADTILGVGYYNNSMDVYACDLETCQDIVEQYNRKVFKQVRNPFTYDICKQITQESILSAFDEEITR